MTIKNEYNDSNKDQINNEIKGFLSFFVIYVAFVEFQ